MLEGQRGGNFLRVTDSEKSIVWLKWSGTHKAYDKIDVKEIEHGS